MSDMLTATYPFSLPVLPYPYNALEPYIDEETMHYHHDKHFQTYITNLNKALEPYPKLHGLTLEQLLRNSRYLPRDAYETILRNAGGTYNHDLFFSHLGPAEEQPEVPGERLGKLIDQTFGSFQAFKEKFTAEALSVFGSGWACLALTPRGKLQIMTLHNQDTSLSQNAVPLILFDVWEHAYYLKYKNDRTEYVNNLWNVVRYPESF